MDDKTAEDKLQKEVALNRYNNNVNPLPATWKTQDAL